MVHRVHDFSQLFFNGCLLIFFLRDDCGSIEMISKKRPPVVFVLKQQKSAVVPSQCPSGNGVDVNNE